MRDREREQKSEQTADSDAKIMAPSTGTRKGAQMLVWAHVLCSQAEFFLGLSWSRVWEAVALGDGRDLAPC